MSENTHDSGPATRRPIPLYLKVLAGVILGAGLGVLVGNNPIPGLGVTAETLSKVGTMIIRLLKALATPLILFAILDAFCRTRLTGKQGVRMVVISLFNVTVAFTIGLVIMNLLQPGLAWRGHLEQLTQESSITVKPTLEPEKGMSKLEDLVPQSLVAPFIDNNVIPIVIFGVLAGAALRKLKDREPGGSVVVLEQAIEAILEILFQMLEWVIQLVPIAVFFVVAGVVGKSGLAVFKTLWVFLAVMLLGLAIHSLIYYPLMAWLVGKKTPREYLGKGADAILTGLSTNSSLATVPITLRTLTQKMGVSQQSARLSACVGTNLNNDGITLYEAMAALFLAQAVGYDLTLWQQLGVVFSALMCGVGVAGIPEAGLIVLPLVLGSAGLPESVVLTALPLIMTVDWIIARCRSAVNVMSDMLVAIMLDALTPEGEPVPPLELHGEGDLAPEMAAILGIETKKS